MCFLLQKHTNIVIFYFKDVSTALDMTRVTLDMTRVTLDMTRVTLDMTMVTLVMTMLAGSDPYERHTDEDEHQVDGLGAEIPLLEDEGGACERYDDRAAAYQ